MQSECSLLELPEGGVKQAPVGARAADENPIFPAKVWVFILDVAGRFSHSRLSFFESGIDSMHPPRDEQHRVADQGRMTSA
jgi:hypothetical protein